MASKPQVSTLGELKESNYKVVPVREELRNNLINKIKAEEEVFPGIIGFENTVALMNKIYSPNGSEGLLLHRTLDFHRMSSIHPTRIAVHVGPQMKVGTAL